jgi:carbamoyl-phosphate synthase small subunit
VNSTLQHAYLLLEDGTRLSGTAFGAVRETDGEVVFNTGMVGYPETMTDPSYQGQILVCTYPLIGNYGVPDEERENGLRKNFESEAIHIQALIVTEYSQEHSHWAALRSLHDWMASENIPGIQGIDTRMLTKKLREQGSMPGRIVYDENSQWEPVEDPNTRDLASEVSVPEPDLYEKGAKKIAVVDCGCKNNIMQAFLRRNISVLRAPYDYDALADDVDGIVFSNGPGDPKMCTQTIENCRKAIDANMPILGICLGSQILALACGADTYKLKYGHRSHNQPVNEAGTKRCYITSQNHGFAIDAAKLPEDWREWFVNDNDGTNEGIIHISKPFFGAQFHPEASPGPDDTEFIFDMFVRALK